MGDWFSTLGVTDNQPTPPPVKVSTRILLAAVEEALMGRTRTELEIVRPDELGLEWTHDTDTSDPNYATRAIARLPKVRGWCTARATICPGLTAGTPDLGVGRYLGVLTVTVPVIPAIETAIEPPAVEIIASAASPNNSAVNATTLGLGVSISIFAHPLPWCRSAGVVDDSGRSSARWLLLRCQPAQRSHS